ncbi:MAG: hypothetical protein ACP5LP_02565 [Candidatus Micrarchaeia archaeon]
MVKMLLLIMTDNPMMLPTPAMWYKMETHSSDMFNDPEEYKGGVEIRTVFWGPSELALSNNDDFLKLYSTLDPKPKACVWFADHFKIHEKLSKYMDVEWVGPYITKSIEEGFQVISF